MNILIEGRMLISDPIALAIGNWGHRIEILEYQAGTGLDKFGNACFDLLLVDVFPPDVKCGEVIPKCRERWPDIGIIAMTDNPSRDQELEVRKHNVLHYMIKPFSMEILKQILDHISKKRGGKLVD